MATSRFDETPQGWTARVLLFSGRRDPRWELPPPSARRLEALWQTLEPLERTPAPPPLGYRGCLACDPSERRWEAYRGAVTLSWTGGRELRGDPRRAFERLVIESAPPGALPENILELTSLRTEDATRPRPQT